MTIQYCYPEGDLDEVCAVNPALPHRTLCSQRVGFVPVVQEAFTSASLHPTCREALWGRGSGRVVEVEPDVFATGVCPECGGTVDLDRSGRVAPHREHLLRGGWRVLGAAKCSGAGQKPEVDQ